MAYYQAWECCVPSEQLAVANEIIFATGVAIIPKYSDNFFPSSSNGL